MKDIWVSDLASPRFFEVIKSNNLLNKPRTFVSVCSVGVVTTRLLKIIVFWKETVIFFSISEFAAVFVHLTEHWGSWFGISECFEIVGIV